MKEFSDIFTEHCYSTAIVMEDSKIDRLVSGISSGRGIRMIRERETDYKYGPCDGNVDFGLTQVPVENKISLMESADKAARAVSPKIKQVSISYGDIIQLVSVENSTGLETSERRIRTRFYINVIARDGDVIQTGYETAGAAKGFELFDEVDVKHLAVKAAERAVRMLSAGHAPSGKMPVVIMSEAGGTLIHEACGHGLEADFIEKKTSIYAGCIGELVASPLVTVIDDATIPGLYGSFEYDDEGTGSKKKVLIENGVLKGFMSDLYYSDLLGFASSGNGRRESFHTKPQPRMTNTYIEKGSMDPGEIVSSISNGLLVKKLGGGQVNVTNGDFVFDVQESYIIENGKVTRPVRGAMLIGNGPKVLRDIDMAGNDLNFITGTCGKGDHAPVTDAMPTVRIPEIVVGGRE